MNLLIIFAKEPEIGKVKTRLAKDIGKEKALKVYKELLKNTLATFKLTPYKVKVYFTPKQKGRNLGSRMRNAFKDNLGKFNKVVLIGVDCPFLTKKIMQQAFQALNKNKIVIGPAKDGGYYLIGLRKPRQLVPSQSRDSVAGFHQLFKGISWGTNKVLQQTLKRCRIKPFLLRKLYDIDRVNDLIKWRSKT